MGDQGEGNGVLTVTREMTINQPKRQADAEPPARSGGRSAGKIKVCCCSLITGSMRLLPIATSANYGDVGNHALLRSVGVARLNGRVLSGRQQRRTG